MLLGEIIALCILFILMPIIVCRLIYIVQKQKHDNFISQVNALNTLRSTLHNTLNSTLHGVSTLPTEQLIKKVKLKKSKIIEKLDTLMELISDKTGTPVVFENLIDSFLDTKILIKLLHDEKKINKDIHEEYIFLKTILYELIKENKFPTSSDFDRMNQIYKTIKKLPTIKK